MKILMLAAVEDTAQQGGEAIGKGVEKGLQFGGRFLLANILWWVRGGLVALTIVLVVIALVQTTRRRKPTASWVAVAVIGSLAFLVHLLFGAVNPL